MLDPQLFRNDIDAVAKRLADRPFVLDVAAFQAIEAERRTVQMRTQELQAGRNAFAKRIGQAKGKGEDITALMAEAGAANAGILAASILANNDAALLRRLEAYRKAQTDAVAESVEDAK